MRALAAVLGGAIACHKAVPHREEDPRSTAASLGMVGPEQTYFTTCTTDIHLQNECAHVGLSVHAPVVQCGMPHVYYVHKYVDCLAIIHSRTLARFNSTTTGAFAYIYTNILP